MKGTYKNKNPKSAKTKRISKAKKEKAERPVNIDTYSDISGDLFEEPVPLGQMENYTEGPIETANEKRLRIAKEIIKKKRQMMKERKISFESQKSEEDFPLQATINLVNRNQHENIDHIFGIKTQESSKETSVQIPKKEITDNVLEQEFQKEIQEKENRVIYPLFSSVKQAIESPKKLPFISLNAHKRPITFCRFDPKTNDLITVSKDSAILRHTFLSSYKKKFLISAGFPKDPHGHQDEILTCDISFDGQYLVTGGKDRVIKLWNLKAQFKVEDSENTETIWLWDFKGHRGDITSLRFRQNSHDFASLSEDRSLKIWDASRKAFMENLFGHASDPIWLERLGTKFMVSAGYDCRPILWKIDQEKIIKFQKQLFSLGSGHNLLIFRLYHRT